MQVQKMESLQNASSNQKLENQNANSTLWIQTLSYDEPIEESFKEKLQETRPVPAVCFLLNL